MVMDMNSGALAQAGRGMQIKDGLVSNMQARRMAGPIRAPGAAPTGADMSARLQQFQSASPQVGGQALPGAQAQMGAPAMPRQAPQMGQQRMGTPAPTMRDMVQRGMSPGSAAALQQRFAAKPGFQAGQGDRLNQVMGVR